MKPSIREQEVSTTFIFQFSCKRKEADDDRAGRPRYLWSTGSWIRPSQCQDNPGVLHGCPAFLGRNVDNQICSHQSRSRELILVSTGPVVIVSEIRSKTSVSWDWPCRTQSCSPGRNEWKPSEPPACYKTAGQRSRSGSESSTGNNYPRIPSNPLDNLVKNNYLVFLNCLEQKFNINHKNKPKKTKWW